MMQLGMHYASEELWRLPPYSLDSRSTNIEAGD